MPSHRPSAGKLHVVSGLVLSATIALLLPAPAIAQFYTVGKAWRVDATGAPTPFQSPTVYNPERVGTLTPRVFFSVFDNSPFAWNTTTFDVTAGPAGGTLFNGNLVSNEGTVGCSLVLNGTPCQNLLAPDDQVAGIYTVTATVSPGGATGTQTFVVGGGATDAAPGVQGFRISGTSDGGGWSYSLSLGDAIPVRVGMPALANGSSAASFVNALVTDVPLSFPGFVAVVGAAADEIDVNAPGFAPFRLWVGDNVALRCQVTGNGSGCEFNPMIEDLAGSPNPVPAIPGVAGVALAGLLAMLGAVRAVAAGGRES